MRRNGASSIKIRRSEKNLRDLRQQITFALYAQEDDLDKVTSTVDHLFTLLMKAQKDL
jgi:type I restriction enzyme, R subunit